MASWNYSIGLRHHDRAFPSTIEQMAFFEAFITEIESVGETRAAVTRA